MTSRFRRLIAFISAMACMAAMLTLWSYQQPLTSAVEAAPGAGQSATAPAAVPRLPDGKPNLQGIWQVRNRAAYDLEDHAARPGTLAGISVVEGGTIPYQAWALKKRNENFATRQTDDPLSKCYMAGVPRIMYLPFPMQIVQNARRVSILFEWSQNYRQIYTDGSKGPEGIEFWMGDSRGRWEGDTLIVNVTDHNDKTWFDMAGNFHSEAMQLVERFTMRDPNTIDYQVTVTDPKIFTRPWTMRMALYRDMEMSRVLEYDCQAEREEANGAFSREPRTWYREAR
jgi:hypothetical protein